MVQKISVISDRTAASRSARKEEVLAAATRIFAQCGYRNTDVQEIADVVGVGKATVYRMYGTKEELFFAAVDNGMQRLNQVVAADSCDSRPPGSAQRLEENLIRFFRFFAENEELIELLMQERSEFRDRDSHSFTRNWLVNSPRWQRKIQDGIAQGVFKNDLPVDGVIKMFSSLCYGAIFTHYFAREHIDLEATAKVMADMVLNGILSDEERERRKQQTPHQ